MSANSTPGVPTTTAPRRWPPELVGALGIGLFAMLLSLMRTLNEPTWPTDFDQWYVAAKALLAGRNPYEVVGPSAEFKWDWPLYYPVTTVALVIPFTVLPVAAARVCMATAGGALLGYAIGKDQFRRLGMVVSAAFLIAVYRNQWSPYITAAYFVPFAAIFIAAKPNMAVPFVAGIRSRRQFLWLVGLGALGAAIVLLVRPRLLLDWLATLGNMPHIVSPIMRPWGWLYVLALLKWRRADARIFLALVCVPQTPSLYDLLPLFVITSSLREVSLLALLTHVLATLIVVLGPFPTFDRYAWQLGYLTTFLIYLPVLALILTRPNVSADAPTPDASTEPRSLRARVEALSRFEALLLLVNVSASVALTWITVSTQRGA